ncbi:hypothetical protein [Halorussus amylolyticus]|nr:hypothetical protein [Halorussus amylolyticus]
MKQSIRVGLILVLLSALLVVGSSGVAFAGECMSIGDVSAQCVCDNLCY